MNYLNILSTQLSRNSDGKNTLLLFPEGMHEVLENARLISDYKNEALQIAKVAKVIREEMFVHEHFKFSGSFPQNCQGASLPYSLKGALSHFRILLSILLIILNNLQIIQVLAAK